MPEAVKEVEALLARAEAAESAQAQAEEKAQASDERYLRLNADFDNFRKRSVSSVIRVEALPRPAHRVSRWHVT